MNNCRQPGGVFTKSGVHDEIVNQSSTTPKKRGKPEDDGRDYSNNDDENFNSNTPTKVALATKTAAATKTVAKGVNTKTAATKKAAAKKAAKTVVKRKKISENAGKPGYKQGSNGRWFPTKHKTTKEGTANRRIANTSRSKIRNALHTCLVKSKERALPSVIQDTNGAVTHNSDIVCFSTKNRIKLKHSEAFYRFVGWKFPEGKCIKHASQLKRKFKACLHLTPDEDYTPAQIRDGATYWSHPKLFPGCDIFAYDAYDE